MSTFSDPPIVSYGANPEEAAANHARAIAERDLARSALPSMATQLGSFAGAMGRWVAAGLPRLDDDQVAARLAICGGCDQFADGRCRVCGCWLLAKARMTTEDCPLGKWNNPSAKIEIA